MITACDGEEAVRLYKKHHQDLKVVLMDVTMPKMGGVEAMMNMRHCDAQCAYYFTIGLYPTGCDE
ncbi:MAG: response regulator [Ghiorsea sp.]|nr:response regulator [Ghiorsea sp.]